MTKEIYFFSFLFLFHLENSIIVLLFVKVYEITFSFDKANIVQRLSKGYLNILDTCFVFWQAR